MKKLSLMLALLLPCSVYAQECECKTQFEWVKKTFEENDAGFEYALSNKGEAAYRQHTEAILEKIGKLEDPAACTGLLYEWLTFFRKGHIAIRPTANNLASRGGEAPNEADIIRQFEDWERLEVDVEEFRESLAGVEQPGYEGIWVSPPYTIGIKQQGDEYVGFIIEADGVYWRRGQVKLRIRPEGEEAGAVFYMRDHSAREFEKAELLGNNYLKMGFVLLERSFPQMEPDDQIEQYVRSMNASAPYLEAVNEQTLLLRIPSFSYNQKQLIDSVIHASRDEILRTPHLIIDLRNNGGGSDASYHELIPLIYTNPIRTVGVMYLSTTLNNQRMLDFANDESWPESDRKWAKEAYDTLNKHLGEFVNLGDSPVSITTRDTIYPYPKQVAIIINENNASTTEQFLLAAKQSKKVKLFGTTTYGILDISNMYFVPAPCGNFELGYCLTKSMRIPEMTIDGKGLQPDFYLDKSIPDYEWIQFVASVLHP